MDGLKEKSVKKKKSHLSLTFSYNFNFVFFQGYACKLQLWVSKILKYLIEDFCEYAPAIAESKS